MKPDVTIIIPAHNAAATLPAQLDAVLAQARATAEILVVDNNSTDDTAVVVERYRAADARVALVPARNGRGPSYARNAGAAAAHAELLLWCDADDVVAPGWCDALLAALADHDYAGGPLEVDRLNPEWLADGRGRWGVDRPGVFGAVEFAHGCNLAIKRSVFLDAGGLAEHLLAGEEIDLALRLRRQGLPLAFVPSAIVHYRYRAELPALVRQAYAYGIVVPELNRQGATVAGFVPETGGRRRSLWLVRHLPALFDRSGRVRWLWLAATLAGRAVGRLRRS